MERFKEHLSAVLRSLTLMLADAAFGALLMATMLSLYDIERSMTLAVGAWAIVCAILAVVCELMASRGVPMLVYLAVNAVVLFFGSGAVVAGTVFLPASAGFPVLLRILVLLCGAHGAFAANKLPTSNAFVRYGDMLILSTALYLSCVYGLDKPLNGPVLGFVIVVFVLNMALTAGLRAGGESDSVIRGAGAGGWLVLLGLFALCLLLTGAVLSLGGDHVGSIVALLKAVWQGFGRIGTLLLTLLAHVILLFSGSGKNIRSDPAVPLDSTTEDVAFVTPAETPAWLPVVGIVVMAALIAAAVVGIFWSMRGIRFSRTKTTRKRRRVTRKSHFIPALLAAFARIRDRISFEIAYLLRKTTPQGLFVLARRTGKRRRLPMKISESPGAYLRRYHAALTAQGHESTLCVLADTLDAVLYGGQQIRLDESDARRFAMQIRRLPKHPSRPQEKP